MSRADVSQQTRAMLAVVWNKNRDLVLHRLESIDSFCRQLPRIGLRRYPARRGSSDAHKLAGSLGMFGLAEGTNVAREIEHRLRDNSTDELLVANLPTLAGQLRNLIESFHVEQEAPQPEPADGCSSWKAMWKWPRASSPTPRSAASSLALPLTSPRLGRRFRTGNSTSWCSIPTPPILPARPGDDYAEQVRDLIVSRSPMQVLALTSVDTFEDRVTAAQVGAHGFLPKTVPVSEIVDTCEHLLDLQSAQFKVLTVDDDVAVLSAVKVLLEQYFIRVSSLSDPRLFWNVLEETAPDLVILDLEMPNFSGLELCRAIRNDAQWNRLPIVFLSSSTDRQTVTNIFSAGADDFVPKPIIEIELTTRVRNRLDRDRLYRNLSDYDQLTSVRNRRSSNVVIANYLRLAERHALPVSLVVVDLDKFKRVNDTYGHQAGDDVLQFLGGLLRQSFRSEDVVARWGGEEFVIAMFAMRRADAIERLANVLEKLEDQEFEPSPGTRFHVSFSAGLSEFPAEGKDLHSLYRVADEALYRAKAAGGRRIYSALTEATDIAIVSQDVTVSAPLRHLLEMRGYSVDLYQHPQDAVRELTGDGASIHARAILLDEPPAELTEELVCHLRAASTASPAIFLLTAAGSADDHPEGVERILKPYKSSALMQRLRRVLTR